MHLRLIKMTRDRPQPLELPDGRLPPGPRLERVSREELLGFYEEAPQLRTRDLVQAAVLVLLAAGALVGAVLAR